MKDSALTKARLDRMIRKFVKGAIELNEHERATTKVPPNSDTVDAELEKLEFAEGEFREALAYRDYRLVYEPAKSFVRSHSLNVSEDSDDFRRVCHELMKAQIFLYQIERKQVVGDYSYQTDYLTPQALPLEPVNKTSEPLSSIVESFWNEKAGDWKVRSQTQYKGVQKWLLDTLGRDTPIHTVDYQTGRDVKEALMAKKNQAGKPLSKDRVNLYLNHISAMWNWAIRQHYAEINPFAGLQLSHKKTRVDELRDAFTVEDLKKMFIDSKEYGQDKWGKATHPHFFWIPLIALYTGCRLEEICQLYVDNVTQEDGIWCLDINEDRPDQSVKKGERRIVPLHPFICKELNFIGYVQGLRNQKGRVFPHLKRINDRWGHSYGQWFGRFKKRNGVTGKKAFHSFRHLLITTLLEKDVADYRVSQLVGHVTKGQTTGRYGKRHQPKMLYEKTVRLLDYPIDLSHIKNSKFVP